MSEPILTPDEIEKIKAQEIVRMQIQRELAPKEKNKLWTFFNSAVGIWLLSTVTVGLVTWGYSLWTESKKTDNANTATIAKIDVEMTNRIIDFENGLNNANNFVTYQSAVYGFLKSADVPNQTPTQTVLKQYENVSTRDLLTQLSQLVSEKEKGEIKEVIIAVNKISGLLKLREMTKGEAYNNPLSGEILNEKNEIEKVLQNDVELDRWKLQ